MDNVAVFDSNKTEIKEGDKVTNCEFPGITFKVLGTGAGNSIRVQADGDDPGHIQSGEEYYLTPSFCTVIDEDGPARSSGSAWGSQEDGNHYKEGIQPAHFSMSRGHNTLQAKVVKYVDRYKKKGGLGDLRKAKHVLEMLIEWEETGGNPDYRL